MSIIGPDGKSLHALSEDQKSQAPSQLTALTWVGLVGGYRHVAGRDKARRYTITSFMKLPGNRWYGSRFDRQPFAVEPFIRAVGKNMN